MSLTARQSQVFDYIVSYQSANRMSPSYQDIMNEFKLASKSNVHRVLLCLKERGYIDWPRNRARSIVILNRPKWS